MQDTPIAPFTVDDIATVQRITAQAWAQGWRRPQYIAALRQAGLLRFAAGILIK